MPCSRGQGHCAELRCRVEKGFEIFLHHFWIFLANFIWRNLREKWRIHVISEQILASDSKIYTSSGFWPKKEVLKPIRPHLMRVRSPFSISIKIQYSMKVRFFPSFKCNHWFNIYALNSKWQCLCAVKTNSFKINVSIFISIVHGEWVF